MAAEINEPTRPSAPTIAEVFDDFLADQAKRLKPRTLAKYRSVVGLLGSYLNGYGHETLSQQEGALFEEHYNARGDAHKEFCEIFGPEHILPGVGMFLGYFMVRKVMAGADLKRAAGTVTKKLAAWLAEKGYVGEAAARGAAQRGAEAARDLPDAERAARILDDAFGDLPFDPNTAPEGAYYDFDHYTIARIEPGKLWLESFLTEGGPIGPIPVPRRATTLLKKNWDISCCIFRGRGRWLLADVANVYPH